MHETVQRHSLEPDEVSASTVNLPVVRGSDSSAVRNLPTLGLAATCVLLVPSGGRRVRAHNYMAIL